MKLFVHGVPDTGYMWTPLIEALAPGEETFLTPTMPGFDGSWPAGFLATAEAYTAWLVGEIARAAQDAGGPIDVVGHDWGAPLVAIAALAQPAHIRSWCVINAAPEPTYQWHKLARIWQTPLAGEFFMAFGTRKKFRQELVVAGMPKQIARHEAPRIDAYMKRAILKLYRSAKTPADWDADFSSIADRGLVMWGTGDPFVPVSYGKTFAKRWSLPLFTERGVGHWGICQRPAPFAERLQTFWDQAG